MWMVGLVLCLVVAGAEEHELEWLLAAIAVAGGIVGLIAMATTGEQQIAQAGQIATNRAEASFAHPVVLGFFLVLTLAPALVMTLRARPVLRPVMIACAGAITGGIVLSLTRGAFIGAGVAALLLLAWPPFRRAAIVVLAIVLVFAAANLQSIERSREVAVVSQRLSTITQAQASQSNERLRIWTRTPSLIAVHPFLGVGPGNFSAYGPQYGLVDFWGAPFMHAHDLLLTIAAERGILGLALFVWFMFEVGRAAAISLRNRASPRFPLALGLVAALAGLFANGVVDYPPGTIVIMFMITVEAGALVALARHERDAVAHGPAPG
jgi:O-antigen ligase